MRLSLLIVIAITIIINILGISLGIGIYFLLYNEELKIARIDFNILAMNNIHIINNNIRSMQQSIWTIGSLLLIPNININSNIYQLFIESSKLNKYTIKVLYPTDNFSNDIPIFQSYMNDTIIDTLYIHPVINNTIIGYSIGIISYNDIFNIDLTYQSIVLTNKSNSIVYISDISYKSSPFSYTYSIPISDTIWYISIYPTDAYIQRYHSSLKYVSFILIIFTSMLITIIIDIIIVAMIYRHMNNIATRELISYNMNNMELMLERISKMNEFRRDIYDSIPEMIIIMDSDGKILDGNKIFFTITRASYDDIRNNCNIHQLFPGEIKEFYKSMSTEFTKSIFKPIIGCSITVNYNAYKTSIDTKRFLDPMCLESSDNKVYIMVVQGTKYTSTIEVSYESKFQKLWKEDCIFRDSFLQFCIQRKNDENIRFIIDVENYRIINSYQLRYIECERISNMYICDNAIRQLNINSSIIANFYYRYKHDIGTISIFDNIYSTIMLNVATDIYTQYIRE